MTEEKALTIMQPQAVMPIMSIQSAVTRYKQMVGFVQEIMHEGTDYGTIPGTSKPTLYKPGAEKLTTFFGLVPRFVPVKVIENFGDDGSEALFYYRCKCELYRNGMLVGEADGSCSSREGKYRWRWVGGEELPAGMDKATIKRRGGRMSEFTFAVDKAETSGKYGKPEEYWQQFKDAIAGGKALRTKKKTAKDVEYDAWEIEAYYYRVPNEDIASVANTVLKMAQKRALVAATLITVNASEFFTQDMEDIAYGGVINTASQTRAPVTAPQAVNEPLDDKVVINGKAAPPSKPEALDSSEWGDIPAPAEWIELWRNKMWALIGFAHENHAKNALKQYDPQNAAEAWTLLLEHQESKVDDAKMVQEPSQEELEF